VVFLVLTARMVLAAVFSLAAVSKALDRAELETALAMLRVPDGLRRLAVLLPVAEFAAAVGLVYADLAWIAALACLLLLLLFSVAIARGLARGISVECRCFGALGLGRLGWHTLLRNAALAGVTVFLVLFGRDEGLAGPTDELAVGCALGLAAGFGLFAGARARAGKLRIGDAAPHHLLRDLNGDAIDLRAGAEGGTLLVFWDATCTACEQLRPHLETPTPGAANGRTAPRVVIVSSDMVDTIRAAGLRAPVVRDESRAVARVFGVPGKPAAVRLYPGGRVASAVILGTPGIVAALREPLGDR
jgi:peroxiredoxin